MKINNIQKWQRRLWNCLFVGLVSMLTFAILILGVLMVNDLNLISGIIIAAMTVFCVLLWWETR